MKIIPSKLLSEMILLRSLWYWEVKYQEMLDISASKIAIYLQIIKKQAESMTRLSLFNSNFIPSNRL